MHASTRFHACFRKMTKCRRRIFRVFCVQWQHLKELLSAPAGVASGPFGLQKAIWLLGRPLLMPIAVRTILVRKMSEHPILRTIPRASPARRSWLHPTLQPQDLRCITVFRSGWLRELGELPRFSLRYICASLQDFVNCGDQLGCETEFR